ncbi:GntR family transcriptional regulator [Actinosynnema sp. CA-248983]
MQPHDTYGVVPVHHRIADALREQIRSGELQPGDPLPSVRELCERWDCAPMTARNAIDVLKAEGRVVGGRGKAATVRELPKRIELSSEWTQAQKDFVRRSEEERRKQGAAEQLTNTPISDLDFNAKYRRVPANDQLATEFDLPAGTELLERTYETSDTRAGHRILWSVSYIPILYIEGNPAILDDTNEPWPGGTQHQLYTVGIELDRFVKTAIAYEPTPRDRQLWGMTQGVPMISVHSKAIDIEGRVVEISDAAYPADRTAVTFVEQLRRWSNTDDEKDA